MAHYKLTRILEQYKEMKIKHPDAVILRRKGDWIVTYYDDARICADITGVTYTKTKVENGERIGLAIFPLSRLDTYLPKFIRAGKRVAIYE